VKIAAALALMGALLVAGCHRAPEKMPADGAGPAHPDVDKTLALDQMLVAHQCSNCHGADYLRVGPPMMAIRAIFPTPTAADADRLKQSILKGSVSKWGDAIMPPQAQVTPEETDKIVAIILDKK
jgi:cytochrome c551/c552